MFESFPLWFIYFLFNLIFRWSHSSKFTQVMMMEVTPRSSFLIGIIRRMQSRSEMLKQNKKTNRREVLKCPLRKLHTHVEVNPTL